MQIGLKMLIAAVCSLSIGVAFAAPLLVSDINIRPWIRHIQGPTADFNVEVVYANFTALNVSTLGYQVVLNITNTADIGAKLYEINFVSAGKITGIPALPFSGGNGIFGGGWEAEGAWVDGKWYNLTFVNGMWPFKDENGSIVSIPLAKLNLTSYWMEGVQLYEATDNGTTTTYMNMNGTWTDVTGRINVTRPVNGGGWSISDPVVEHMETFQETIPENVTMAIKSPDNGSVTWTSTTPFLYRPYVCIETGEGHFDNYWAPHESRLIVLQGTQYVIPLRNGTSLDVLKTGNVTLHTRMMNDAAHNMSLPINTVDDTYSYNDELKQVQLAQSGSSYVYNTILGEDQTFQTDQWGVEAFLKPRS
jgi:hypothetical protein